MMQRRRKADLARGVGAVAVLLVAHLTGLASVAQAGDPGDPTLTVSQSASATTVNLAETVDYTITVQNWSRMSARGVQVIDELSPPVTLLSATYVVLGTNGIPREVGACASETRPVSTRVTCSLVEPLEGVERATVSILAEPNTTGNLGSTATATAQGGYTSPDQPRLVTSVVNGLGCTIIGTSGPDNISGTANRDVICALGGDDTVTGAGRNDAVYGSSGNDNLSGARGTDTLDGGLGNDLLAGGPGQDVLDGGPGGDILRGHGGADVLDGRDDVSGNDTVNGGAGSDTCNADPGDTLTNCP